MPSDSLPLSKNRGAQTLVLAILLRLYGNADDRSISFAKIEIKIPMKKIILTILSAAIFHGNLHAADDPVIPVRPHAWLESLSKNDQRIALVSYQIALGKKVEEVTASAKNNKDRMWGLKIFTCGHLFAAQSATKNDDQREALAAITAALRDGFSGKGNPDSRKKNLRAAELMGQKIADSIPDSAFNRFQEKYATESKRFNNEFIVAAAQCASDSGAPK